MTLIFSIFSVLTFIFSYFSNYKTHFDHLIKDLGKEFRIMLLIHCIFHVHLSLCIDHFFFLNLKRQQIFLYFNILTILLVDSTSISNNSKF